MEVLELLEDAGHGGASRDAVCCAPISRGNEYGPVIHRSPVRDLEMQD